MSTVRIQSGFLGPFESTRASPRTAKGDSQPTLKQTPQIATGIRIGGPDYCRGLDKYECDCETCGISLQSAI